MSLGKRLLDLRKSKQLSQEEVADKLNVTRQTVSKWETDQSTPDFDKIIPLCALYGVSSDQLLTGNAQNVEEKIENVENKEESSLNYETRKKRAIGIGVSVFLYILSVAWLLISISVLYINPVASTVLFLLICAVSTYIIIYTNIMYKEKESDKEGKQHGLVKQITGLLSIITLIIYLVISFITMAWNITWIIWIIYALLCKILKLAFGLKGDKDDE